MNRCRICNRPLKQGTIGAKCAKLYSNYNSTFPKNIANEEVYIFKHTKEGSR